MKKSKIISLDSIFLLNLQCIILSDTVGKPANSKGEHFYVLPHYTCTGGFAPAQAINVPAAVSGVMQRVSEITLFFFSLPDKFNNLNYTVMNEKVKFNTATKYQITESELKHLYTVMALMQFPYECNPEYKDRNLVRRLRNKFNDFNLEMTKVCENDPNNLILSQVHNFIQRHYGYLRKVSAMLEEEQLDNHISVD